MPADSYPCFLGVTEGGKTTRTAHKVGVGGRKGETWNGPEVLRCNVDVFCDDDTPVYLAVVSVKQTWPRGITKPSPPSTGSQRIVPPPLHTHTPHHYHVLHHLCSLCVSSVTYYTASENNRTLHGVPCTKQHTRLMAVCVYDHSGLELRVK